MSRGLTGVVTRHIVCSWRQGQISVRTASKLGLRWSFIWKKNLQYFCFQGLKFQIGTHIYEYIEVGSWRSILSLEESEINLQTGGLLIYNQLLNPSSWRFCELNNPNPFGPIPPSPDSLTNIDPFSVLLRAGFPSVRYYVTQSNIMYFTIMNPFILAPLPSDP